MHSNVLRQRKAKALADRSPNHFSATDICADRQSTRSLPVTFHTDECDSTENMRDANKFSQPASFSLPMFLLSGGI